MYCSLRQSCKKDWILILETLHCVTLASQRSIPRQICRLANVWNTKQINKFYLPQLSLRYLQNLMIMKPHFYKAIWILKKTFLNLCFQSLLMQISLENVNACQCLSIHLMTKHKWCNLNIKDLHLMSLALGRHQRQNINRGVSDLKEANFDHVEFRDAKPWTGVEGGVTNSWWVGVWDCVLAHAVRQLVVSPRGKRKVDPSIIHWSWSSDGSMWPKSRAIWLLFVSLCVSLEHDSKALRFISYSGRNNVGLFWYSINTFVPYLQA